METESGLIFRNPSDGEWGCRIVHFEDDKHFNEVQRIPYFSIVLVLDGEGKLKVDFTDYQISKRAMLFFAPFQPFMIDGTTLTGVMINFHPDFFCIFRHRNEVACDGVLFNNPNEPPFFTIPENEISPFYSTIKHITDEMAFAGLAQQDLLIAYLKILLIRAIRIKSLKGTTPVLFDQGPTEAAFLRQLIRMIELHYKTKLCVGEYAELLNIPIKTLGRIVKKHFQRSLTKIITDRVIMEAKRELNLTSKTLKEIAYDLGFNNEYHFSRYFKNKVKISPRSYRNALRNEQINSLTRNPLLNSSVESDDR